MPAFKLILLFASISAGSVLGQPIHLKQGQSTKVGGTLVTCSASVVEPETTSRCIDQDMAGKCIEWDYTYYLPGVSCTATCRDRDPQGKCKIRDKCIPLASGVFRHETCIDIGPIHNCRAWSENILYK